MHSAPWWLGPLLAIVHYLPFWGPPAIVLLSWLVWRRIRSGK